MSFWRRKVYGKSGLAQVRAARQYGHDVALSEYEHQVAKKPNASAGTRRKWLRAAESSR